MIRQTPSIAYPNNLHNAHGKTVLIIICLFFARLAAADFTLFDAAKAGDTVKLEQVLAAGADLNMRDDSGYTALMWAARKGRLETVRYLTERGADLVAFNRDGSDAYKLATKFGHYNVTDYLEQQPGATPKSRKRLRRENISSSSVVGVDNCLDQVGAMNLIQHVITGRRWYDIANINKSTLGATFESSDIGYRVKIKYDPVSSKVTLEYISKPYGQPKHLIKTAKIIKKHIRRHCRLQGQSK